MRNKKLINMLLACAMTITCLMPKNKFVRLEINANSAEGLLYYQFDDRWKNIKFTKYAKSSNTMASSGCGIFSFCNAIYALNGIRPDAIAVAAWGVQTGGYRPGAGGLYRYDFYEKVESAYSQEYRFYLEHYTYGNVTDARLIQHLQSGGVAVIHVASHFMVISHYNPEDNTYYVLESAPVKSRGLETTGWVSAETLLNTNSTRVDWYALLSNIPLIGDVNADNQLNTKDVALLQNYLLGNEKFTKKQFQEADVNQDGSVNIYDLIALKHVIQQMQLPPVVIEEEPEETTEILEEAPEEVPTESTEEPTQEPMELPTETTQEPTELPTEITQELTELPTETTQEPTELPTGTTQEPTEETTAPIET
ncbi:MAG: dockerin type I repeat-containing protein [Oscillospiraceae bacterium]|nr:dockerin type I repeat-containing protein [Oscillospiraceae bacterium]